MKSTFLFLVTTTMMTCTALGQPSIDKKNVLPDWAFGGFELPQGANPVISPIENTKFYCPMTQDYVHGNPMTLSIRQLPCMTARLSCCIGQKINPVSVSVTVPHVSDTPLRVTAFTSSGKRLRYFIRITILKRNWNGRADAKTRVSPSQQKDCM